MVMLVMKNDDDDEKPKMRVKFGKYLFQKTVSKKIQSSNFNDWSEDTQRQQKKQFLWRHFGIKN